MNTKPSFLAGRRLSLGLVLGIGAVLRVAVVIWAAPRFPPSDDGSFYHVVAQRIAEGHGYTWLWPDGVVTYAAHYPVGYPALISGLYALLGPAAWLAMALNAAVGVAAIFAAHQLLLEHAGRAAALWAALLVALDPALVLYTGALMTEGLVAALLTIAAWIAIKASRAATVSGWTVALGALFGLMTLVRPQCLVLAPAFAALCALGRTRETPSVAGKAAFWGPIASRMLLVTAVALAACVPWTLRNCARMERCVFVSANGGWNLLIGTSPEGNGAWAPLEQIGVPENCRTVFAEAEKDACFGQAALERIRERPLAWLSLVPAKLGATFDIRAPAAQYFHRAASQHFGESAKWVVGALETVWGRTMGALALFALWRAGRRARRGLGSEGQRNLSTALALVGGLGFLSPWGALGVVFLVGLAVAEWRVLWAMPSFGFAPVTLAATALTHAVFFGADRYSLVASGLLACLAGGALGRTPAGSIDGRAPSVADGVEAALTQG